MRRLIFALILSVTLYACSGDPVSTVKNGVMNGYEGTSIGKAFEASFDEPKWETIKTKKGQTIVRFTGKISKKLHETAVNSTRRKLEEAIKEAQSKYGDAFGEAIAKLDMFKLSVHKILGEKKIAEKWGLFDVAKRATKHPFFKGLSKELGCKGVRGNFINANNFWIEPDCPDAKRSQKYISKTIDKAYELLWPEGTPVEVEWMVNTDGATFRLIKLSSPAWVGIKAIDILDVIYE